MVSQGIQAAFSHFQLPSMQNLGCTAVIPTVRGNLLLKYGGHACYFFNFQKQKGLCVTINHWDIILPGLKRFFQSNYRKYSNLHALRSMFQPYHYRFNFIEQIMIMTVPHTVTPISAGRFFINLWSYFGYLDIDCSNKSIRYQMIEDDYGHPVMGSQQFYDSKTDEVYYLAYSLKDSMERVISPDKPVETRVLKRPLKGGNAQAIWSGGLVDYLHDILINSTRQYCVACELGMFTDANKNIIPSKVLVVDMKNNRSWTISKFIVAAHAQFDPVEPDVIYFSNHNFAFTHSSLFMLLKNAIYGIDFKGPASIYKYVLTSDGPKELAAYTQKDFFRLTNFHVFMHRGQKIIAATSSPNFIFIIDAQTMAFIRKFEISHPRSLKHLYKDIKCIVGTIAPSPDGEKLFVHTTRSFQVVDIESGKPDMIIDHLFHHTCSNHMIAVQDADWK